jgi:hypothetical protein
MTTIGKIDVFDETQESWETYVERVQHFFAAYDVVVNHQLSSVNSVEFDWKQNVFIIKGFTFARKACRQEL